MFLGLRVHRCAAAIVAIAAGSLACSRDNPLFGQDAGLDGDGDGGASSSPGTGALTVSAGSEGGTGSLDTGVLDTGPLDTGPPDTGAGSCGDGEIGGNEDCDDGPDNGDLASCHHDCTFNTCGDGFPGPGQPCDDGNDIDDDACSNACVPATCGNGVVDPEEACDLSAPNPVANCTRKCTLNVCHDGIQFGNELCDDGNTNDDDDCVGECVLATCGDGYLRLGDEQCDPGVPITMTCEDFGYVTGAVHCNDDCTFDATDCYTCGNGIVEGPEHCDFGKSGAESCGSLGWTGNGDATCSSTCELTLDETCCVPTGLACLLADGSICCSLSCNAVTGLCN